MTQKKPSNPAPLPAPLDDQLCYAVYSAGMAIQRTYKPLLDELGLTGRMLRKMPAARDAIQEGDFRDWEEIDRWAHGIGRELNG